ncbi:MAG TPA: response regulator transcription factor [Thermoanaerobaculia bacterium]|jgi:two-component system NarL family response regulator
MQRFKILIARRAPNETRLANAHFSVEEVSQMTGLVEALVNRKPAVLLLAVDFPGLGGPAGLRQIRRLNPATKIIVLSRSVNEHEELEVLRLGARGYCGPIESDVLLKMIEKVQQGEVWAGRKTIGALLEEFFGSPEEIAAPEPAVLNSQLEQLTSREREILQLLGGGASNKEIANALNVSVSTIKAHLTKIFRKLGQPDRLRLALYASRARGTSRSKTEL